MSGLSKDTWWIGNPVENPAVVRVWVCLRLTYDLNSALDSTDGGQNPFSESLIVCPNHKKVFYDNKSTRKNCSKYKEPFKSISRSASSRILFGRSKYKFWWLYVLLIHYSLPLNHDFTEPVFSHTSSASDMVNKMNHISTLSLYWKMS